MVAAPDRQRPTRVTDRDFPKGFGRSVTTPRRDLVRIRTRQIRLSVCIMTRRDLVTPCWCHNHFNLGSGPNLRIRLAVFLASEHVTIKSRYAHCDSCT